MEGNGPPRESEPDGDKGAQSQLSFTAKHKCPRMEQQVRFSYLIRVLGFCFKFEEKLYITENDIRCYNII